MRKAGKADALPARPAPGLYGASAAASAKGQHVVHVVEPRRLAAQPLRGAQGAHRVGGAALRAHGDLHALTGAREKHGVLAHDVAAADGVEADLFRRALAGLALAAVASDLRQLALERLG